MPTALAPVAIRGQDLRFALAQREPRASFSHRAHRCFNRGCGSEDDGSPAVALLALIAVAWLSFFGVAAAQTDVPPRPDPPSRNFRNAQLRGGWYPWDPYQYQDYKRGVPVLTGFDIEIERALARIIWSCDVCGFEFETSAYFSVKPTAKLKRS